MTRSCVFGMAVIACAACVAWGAPALLAIPAGTLVAAAALRALWLAVGQVRVAMSLHRASHPGALATVPVRLAANTGVVAVAGLWRPVIYCDPTVTDALDPAERRAVALHEAGHARRRDPLRLLLVSVVAPVMRSTTAGRAWVERRRASLEIAADEHALESGADRRALASALIALGGRHAPTAAVGFTSAVDLRLAALLGDPLPRGTRRRAGLVAAAVVVAVCAGMFALEAHTAADGLACLLGWCRP